MTDELLAILDQRYARMVEEAVNLSAKLGAEAVERAVSRALAPLLVEIRVLTRRVELLEQRVADLHTGERLRVTGLSEGEVR